MALFDNERERSDSLSGDAATRALSVTVVENHFVERVYEKLASVYDLVFGPTLHPGRLEAIKKMNIQPGDSVLEVGVGTGINLSLYPSSCAITGIDLSTPMLEKARERIFKKGLRNCRVTEMDAAAMSFPDESFDIVYAPYLISVVPDPVKVAQEMRRVCRRGGRIVILNHFKSQNRMLSALRNRHLAADRAHRLQVRSRPKGFLTQAELTPISIEKVNIFEDVDARDLRQRLGTAQRAFAGASSFVTGAVHSQAHVRREHDEQRVPLRVNLARVIGQPRFEEDLAALDGSIHDSTRPANPRREMQVVDGNARPDDGMAVHQQTAPIASSRTAAIAHRAPIPAALASGAKPHAGVQVIAGRRAKVAHACAIGRRRAGDEGSRGCFRPNG